MYITSDIIAKLESMGLSPKKSLGQNFLVSQLAISKIVDAVRAFEAKELYEVGPGLGSLTDRLRELQLPLTLLELDRAFAEWWRQQGANVIEGDALKWDWNRIENPSQTILVSNLPYQISSSIVIDRSVQEKALKGMVLMFQKEVAERIVAKPKTEAYGLLSVVAQNFWTVKPVLEAGPRDFYPPPRVASRVLAFTQREDWQGSKKNFLKVVKAGFAQRRKLLISNLKVLGGQAVDEKLRLLFSSIGIEPKARAEELTIEQWRFLTKSLFPDRD